jgi:hypothetical protein
MIAINASIVVGGEYKSRSENVNHKRGGSIKRWDQIQNKKGVL